jgi:hypothetical protein
MVVAVPQKGSRTVSPVNENIRGLSGADGEGDAGFDTQVFGGVPSLADQAVTTGNLKNVQRVR